MEGEDGLAIPQRRVFQFLSIIYFTLKSCGTNRVIQRQFLRIFLPFFFFFNSRNPPVPMVGWWSWAKNVASLIVHHSKGHVPARPRQRRRGSERNSCSSNEQAKGGGEGGLLHDWCGVPRGLIRTAWSQYCFHGAQNTSGQLDGGQ